MTKRRKWYFIAGQFIAALVLGIGGAYLSTEHLIGNMMLEILFAFVVLYSMMLLGVCIVGIFYLRTIGRTKDFGRSILVSLAGLILFLAVVVLSSLWLSASHGVLYFVFPLIGMIIGFHLPIRQDD